MKRMILFFVFAAILGVAIGANGNCDAQIQQYRQCQDRLKQSRQTERQKTANDKSPTIDRCFTSNGCQAPARPNPSSNGAPQKQRDQCHTELNQRLKANVQQCVRRSAPGFSFPTDQNTPSHRSQQQPVMNRKLVEKSCGGSETKAKAVQECIKKQHGESSVAEKDRKDRFDSNCQEKKRCDASLDASCRTQLATLKRTICQCNQQERSVAKITAVRASIPTCSAPTPVAQGSGTIKHHQQAKDTGGQ